jgi:hypothetical protein
MTDGKFKDIVPNAGIPEMASKGPISSLTSREVIWKRVLSSYSRAELSNPGDREAALSGIMKVLEGVFADTCIAGLWRKELPAQLAWRALPFATSTPTYRAPSWSWLSIDGEIEAYPPPVTKETDSGSLSLPRYVVAELKHIAIARVGDSALSPITSGFIRLRGMLHPVTWEKDRAPRGSTLADLKVEDDRGSDLLGHFDGHGFAAKGSAWIMQIVVERESEGLFGHGLLLQRNPDGVFRRIGCCFFSSYPEARYLLSKRHQAMMEGEKEFGEKSAAEVIERTSSSNLQTQSASEEDEEQTIVII